jgi:hypothetical protein
MNSRRSHYFYVVALSVIIPGAALLIQAFAFVTTTKSLKDEVSWTYGFFVDAV